MSDFIELHIYESGIRYDDAHILVNKQEIARIGRLAGEFTSITTKDGYNTVVYEGYDKVKKMLTEEGD